MAEQALGRVHFMGVGGAGMSGIARIMAMRGWQVSGCDAKDSRAVSALRALGVEVQIGHDPQHLHAVDTLIYSSAIRSSHPELAQARAQGMTVLQRAQGLAEVMRDREVIAVAGTHGKTTTTSMTVVALQHAGLDPSFAIGGTLSDSGANAHDGSGSLFVAEADESDGSFVHYRPHIAIITNIEADHLDHYADLDAVVAAFADFAATVTGTVIAGGDDEHAAVIARDHRGLTFGFGPANDLRIVDLQSAPTSFRAVWKGRDLGEVRLAVPGRHNALNAAAALTAGLAVGADPTLLIEGLSAFSGTRRRFDVRGSKGKVTVVDDYAHHPTEINATIAAAREVYPDRQVVVVFQPHRFSRTAAFLTEFATALARADEVVVTEVYAAGEDAIPGASGAALAHAIADLGGRVRFEPALIEIPNLIAAVATDPTCVLTVGAGDITLIAPEILAALP